MAQPLATARGQVQRLVLRAEVGLAVPDKNHAPTGTSIATIPCPPLPCPPQPCARIAGACRQPRHKDPKFVGRRARSVAEQRGAEGCVDARDPSTDVEETHTVR